MERLIDGRDLDDPNTPEDESVDDAVAALNHSEQKGVDGGEKIARDLSASWLNYLAGNNVDPTSSDQGNIDNASREWIQDGINVGTEGFMAALSQIREAEDISAQLVTDKPIVFEAAPTKDAAPEPLMVSPIDHDPDMIYTDPLLIA